MIAGSCLRFNTAMIFALILLNEHCVYVLSFGLRKLFFRLFVRYRLHILNVRLFFLRNNTSVVL
jgi:hypothetical protein